MADPANELPGKSEERDAKSPEKSREWEPFQTLRREIDRVFENFHHGPFGNGRCICGSSRTVGHLRETPIATCRGAGTRFTANASLQTI
jgi:hypothetical protein